MPVRNIVKQYGEGYYYHVYNRGVDKQNIFEEPDDYAVFLNLFKRHLSVPVGTDNYGRPVISYANKIDLIAYCLMPNHFHLLVFLKDSTGLEKLMRSTMTAYSMYFNKRRRRRGSLFQGHFLASLISDDAYFWHVSRYIHLNPLSVRKDPFSYPYSSLAYFAGKKEASWLHPEHFVESANDRQNYLKFVKDYEAMHQELDQLKHLLAATEV